MAAAILVTTAVIVSVQPPPVRYRAGVAYLEARFLTMMADSGVLVSSVLIQRAVLVLTEDVGSEIQRVWLSLRESSVSRRISTSLCGPQSYQSALASLAPSPPVHPYFSSFNVIENNKL